MNNFPTVFQIRTEDMDLIAERGIAAHYSGRGVVSGPVRPGISSGRNLDGKVICLNNTGFALRVYIFLLSIVALISDLLKLVLHTFLLSHFI
jgi:hypothetical protein